jgi:hypothetical protein
MIYTTSVATKNKISIEEMQEQVLSRIKELTERNQWIDSLKKFISDNYPKGGKVTNLFQKKLDGAFGVGVCRLNSNVIYATGQYWPFDFCRPNETWFSAETFEKANSENYETNEREIKELNLILPELPWKVDRYNFLLEKIEDFNNTLPDVFVMARLLIEVESVEH